MAGGRAQGRLEVVLGGLSLALGWPGGEMLFLVRKHEPEKTEHPGGQTRPCGRDPGDTWELAQTAAVTALPMPTAAAQEPWAMGMGSQC